MVVVSTQEQLKDALTNKTKEIIVIDAELAENIGKFIERLNFKTNSEYKNIVNITGIGLLIGATVLTNLMAFGFLILGIKVLLVPEIILLLAFLILLAIKLNNLLKNNYEIVKRDEEGGASQFCKRIRRSKHYSRDILANNVGLYISAIIRENK